MPPLLINKNLKILLLFLSLKISPIKFSLQESTNTKGLPFLTICYLFSLLFPFNETRHKLLRYIVEKKELFLLHKFIYFWYRCVSLFSFSLSKKKRTSFQMKAKNSSLFLFNYVIKYLCGISSTKK